MYFHHFQMLLMLYATYSSIFGYIVVYCCCSPKKMYDNLIFTWTIVWIQGGRKPITIIENKYWWILKSMFVDNYAWLIKPQHWFMAFEYFGLFFSSSTSSNVRYSFWLVHQSINVFHSNVEQNTLKLEWDWRIFSSK